MANTFSRLFGLQAQMKQLASTFTGLYSGLLSLWLSASLCSGVMAAEPANAVAAVNDTSAQYNPALAAKTGANENGLRSYVFVLLKSSGNPLPKGPERDEMFKGHFANMTRLADAGVLAYAGPLDGVDGWRGLFIMAVDSIEEAQKHVATDPVISKGEMVAEYHKHFGSAALMLVNDLHKQISKNEN